MTQKRASLADCAETCGAHLLCQVSHGGELLARQGMDRLVVKCLHALQRRGWSKEERLELGRCGAQAGLKGAFLSWLEMLAERLEAAKSAEKESFSSRALGESQEFATDTLAAWMDEASDSALMPFLSRGARRCGSGAGAALVGLGSGIEAAGE